LAVGGDPRGGLTGHYAFGYEEGVQTYLQLHTADRCAEFIRPYLSPGMSLLDAGCGPGTVTIGLAELVSPGSVTAVDVSAGEVEKTRAALVAAGFNNVHAEVADVRNLRFADRCFDALFSQAVLDYLDDPMVALREFHRVLKPGGVIGLRSPNNNLSVIGPENELIDEGMALFRRAVAHLGGSADEGKLLGSRLKNAGFERIFVSSTYEQARSRDEWPSVMHAFASMFDGTRVAEIMVEQGWADTARIEAIVTGFKEFGRDSSNYFGLPWTAALGFKPA
jgi:SAM-dependent methyltransferase